MQHFQFTDISPDNRYPGDMREQVEEGTEHILTSVKSRINRFADAWAIGGTPLVFPSEEGLSIDDGRYTADWYQRMSVSDKNESTRHGSIPCFIEAKKMRNGDTLYMLTPKQ
jgi:hypothetical protein